MKLLPPDLHHDDEIDGLRTQEEIDLYRQREATKRERAKRRYAETCVRHLQLELVIRAALFALIAGGWVLTLLDLG